MKGHGREMIQLGLPIADAPVEDDAAGTSKGMLHLTGNFSFYVILWIQDKTFVSQYDVEEMVIDAFSSYIKFVMFE